MSAKRIGGPGWSWSEIHVLLASFSVCPRANYNAPVFFCLTNCLAFQTSALERPRPTRSRASGGIACRTQAVNNDKISLTITLALQPIRKSELETCSNPKLSNTPSLQVAINEFHPAGWHLGMWTLGLTDDDIMLASQCFPCASRCPWPCPPVPGSCFGLWIPHA